MDRRITEVILGCYQTRAMQAHPTTADTRACQDGVSLPRHSSAGLLQLTAARNVGREPAEIAGCSERTGHGRITAPSTVRQRL